MWKNAENGYPPVHGVLYSVCRKYYRKLSAALSKAGAQAVPQSKELSIRYPPPKELSFIVCNSDLFASRKFDGRLKFGQIEISILPD